MRQRHGDQATAIIVDGYLFERAAYNKLKENCGFFNASYDDDTFVLYMPRLFLFLFGPKRNGGGLCLICHSIDMLMPFGLMNAAAKVSFSFLWLSKSSSTPAIKPTESNYKPTTNNSFKLAALVGCFWAERAGTWLTFDWRFPPAKPRPMKRNWKKRGGKRLSIEFNGNNCRHNQRSWLESTPFATHG